MSAMQRRQGVLNMCSIIIIGGRPTCPTTPGYVCGARSQSAAAAAEPLGGERWQGHEGLGNGHSQKKIFSHLRQKVKKTSPSPL